ncbi:MAG TPA: PTS sugar transporter subunit IIA [Rubricoccaceae bacterium]|jgi:PTS system fructose-specific IIA component|nr:PTS sugar transporter subunit IIA [Rubricoccaceae bacterium]
MLRTDALSVASLLAPERVQVGLPAQSKEAVIEAVIEQLGGAPAVRDLGRVRDAVFAREAVMSTGVGKGLALPHARTDAVSDTVAAFAVTAGPVDYGALDGQPVRLVFLLVGPEGERSTHVRLLSRISRLMNRDAFRARLLQARDAEAVLAAFREGEEEIG